MSTEPRILEILRGETFKGKREIMSTTRIKRKITIERLQSAIIHQTSLPTLKIWCEACGFEIKMIYPKEVSQLLGITQREVFRRLEREEFHFRETETGEVFICPNSIEPK